MQADREPSTTSLTGRRAARAALIPYLVALALIVFLPARDAGRVTGLIGWAADLFASIGLPRDPTAAALEFVANIALFVPWGILLPLALPRLRWWLVITSGCLTSGGIELMQLVIPSRFPTVSDVVANTAGAAFGVWLALARRDRPRTRRPTAQPGLARPSRSSDGRRQYAPSARSTERSVR